MARPPASDLPSSWDEVTSAYQPERVPTPAIVLEQDATKHPGGWADPEVVPREELARRLTWENGGQLRFDDEGRPLNPAGPTGRAGRLLGKWGPNHAADPIILRRQPGSGRLQMLAIERKDTGRWAIPGGMVDEGESITATLARELLEETGVALDLGSAVPVYRGVVKDDPRNTDHAWMETSVSVLLLEDEEAARLEPRAGDDAADVQWLDLTEANLRSLYANHGEFVRAALARLGLAPEPA